MKSGDAYTKQLDKQQEQFETIAECRVSSLFGRVQQRPPCLTTGTRVAARSRAIRSFLLGQVKRAV